MTSTHGLDPAGPLGALQAAAAMLQVGFVLRATPSQPMRGGLLTDTAAAAVPGAPATRAALSQAKAAGDRVKVSTLLRWATAWQVEVRAWAVPSGEATTWTPLYLETLARQEPALSWRELVAVLAAMGCKLRAEVHPVTVAGTPSATA